MKIVSAMILTVFLLMPMAQAGQVGLGAGVSGGLEFPIAQQDQKQGSVFCLKARIGVMPIVTLEPGLSFTRYGDPEFDDFTSDLEGAKVTGYILDATLGGSFGGTGVEPYGLFGIGYYNTSLEHFGDDKKNFGWSAGFGLEIGVAPRVGLDFRGRVAMISTDGGGTKKSGSVTGGINIYFGK
ncbi:MAG: porin family protein [candidate division Zixibacteria bacterium]|nr:porin family protein [candidate division Zixibacteria bacterium]